MVRKVLWSGGNVVTMLCETRAEGVRGTAVYRLIQDAKGTYGAFEKTKDERVLDIALSPDGTLAALMGPDGVSWKDYAGWQDKGAMSHPSPLHVLWLGDDELLVAGASYIERYEIGHAMSTPRPSPVSSVIPPRQPTAGSRGHPRVLRCHPWRCR